MSTGKWSNHCAHRKMEESWWVPLKSIIRASIGKLFEWVPKRGPINMCTEKWKNPGEYQEKVESVRVSKNCSSGYQKRVQSMCAPKNGRIRVTTKKKYNPCEYRKTIRMGTEKGSNQCVHWKWKNPGEYEEKVESVRVSKNCSDEYRKRVQSMCAPKNGRIRVSTKKK